MKAAATSSVEKLRLDKPVRGRLPVQHPNGIKRLLSIALTLGSLLAAQTFAADDDRYTQLIRKADQIKSSNYGEFGRLLQQLGDASEKLTPEEAAYLSYLKGWRSAYEGKYRQAVDELTPIVDSSAFPTLRLRAGATMTNVLVLSAQYQQAFTHLNRFLSILPSVQDKAAREQALGVAAYVYIYVGEYDLSLRYAQALLTDNWEGRGTCTGGQLKLQATFKMGQFNAADPYAATVIEECERIGEVIRASAVRTYIAKQLLADGRAKEAMQSLADAYEKTRALRSPQILSEYDSLIAQIQMQLGDRILARQYALRAINDGVKNEFTEPLIKAYLILYQLAKSTGDTSTSLAYHEKYTTADKGYLDDTTARQIAYERVQHEVAENQLQIDSLNKQNEVLKLQRQLSNKALENVRLYIILSTVVLCFILMWAYKTKRSQLHFMKLSQQDGLTGIFNRPHFIDQAMHALKEAERSGTSICIAICDLDHFKAINDNWGHATGDDVLKQAATRFTTNIRTNDAVGRLGGEEFGILLSDCDMKAARDRCERIRLALAEIVITQHGAESRLSASFGVAGVATSGHDFRQLLAHADSALYRAKRGGRNRIVLHGEEVPTGPAYDAADDRLSA